MQRVLSKDLWTEVRKQARVSTSRKVAIAYVTRDLVGFRKGDTLVVDASKLAIQNGETDAPLLRKLHKKGVQLYDCADLHAKVLLLDDVAVIGSGNMSSSSERRMVEAALISDHGSVVAGVASLIEQLVNQSSPPLDKDDIARLCKIKVIRRGGENGTGRKRRKTRISDLGNQTWIVGVHELKHDPKPKEQRLIESATHSLREQLGASDDDFSWIKWGVRGRFARECRTGDLLIQIWRSANAKRPSLVWKAVPVLLKQRTKRWTRFYVAEPTGRSQEIGWGQFQRLLREIAYPRRVKAGSVQLLAPDIADAIGQKWNAAART